MLNYVVSMMAGAALTGSVYMAGWGGNCGGAATSEGDSCDACTPIPRVMAAETPATVPAGKTDMKNTKCIVTGEDPMGPDVTVEYQGKIYHCCCTACPPTFNKDPEKYVKAFEADKAKFGVK